MIDSKTLIDLFWKTINEHWGYIWGTAGAQWTQAKQNQKVSYMVNKYGTSWKTNSEAKEDNYYYAAKDGAKWIGHTVADCSGLFVWAYKQEGQSIAHGSNSIWNRYCQSKGKLSGGKRTDGQVLKPGTAVFVYKEDKDNRSHIGLYVGGDLVIEAQGTNAGVTTSLITNKKWAEWGELKGVAYEGGDQPMPDKKPTLKRGDRGEYVTLAQTELIQKGYSCGSYGADGKFGQATEDAVKRFQRDCGLTTDGVIGPETWEALDKIQPVTTLYTVQIPHLTEYKAEALLKQYPGSSMIKEER